MTSSLDGTRVRYLMHPQMLRIALVGVHSVRSGLLLLAHRHQAIHVAQLHLDLHGVCQPVGGVIIDCMLQTAMSSHAKCIAFRSFVPSLWNLDE